MLSTKNTKDCNSALFGCCHNVGAGGVGSRGAINWVRQPSKRLIQWLRRTERAVGNPVPYDN